MITHAYKAQTLIDSAIRYAKNGYKLVPCILTEKDGRKDVRFMVSAWREADYLYALTEAKIKWWVAEKKVNAFLGVHPDKVIVDFDDSQALKTGTKWLGRIDIEPRARIKTGKGEHWYFENDGSLDHKQHFKKIDIQVGRANGGVFIAGSWHPVENRHYEIISTTADRPAAIGIEHISVLRTLEGKTTQTHQNAPESPNIEPEGKARRFSMKMIDEADWSEGRRNATLNLLSFRAAQLGSDKLMHYIKIKALEAGLSETETDATQKSARDGAIRRLLEPEDSVGFQYEWADAGALSTNDAYAIKYVFDANGIDYRFNIRSQRIELRLKDREWLPVGDRNAKQFATEIARKYAYRTPSGQLRPLKFSLGGFLEELLAVVADREQDPFISDYLDVLPEWDGTGRIDQLLSDLFDTRQTQLTAWASKYIFIGAIQRAIKPGCKLDEMPVLYGRQGLGKSTLLYSALPHSLSSRYDLFTDQIDFQARHKDLVEAITGRVIVECQEMRGSTKVDHAKIKAFLTSRNDNAIRAAYARQTESRPRRCIFVGTTDRLDALPNDPAGNRRFVFIRLGDQSTSIDRYFNEPVGMHTYRAQCWAEAYTRYKKGERANLPRSLMPQQKELNMQHRSANEVIEDIIEKNLQHLIAISDKEQIQATRLYELCVQDLKAIKPYQIQNYLTMEGFESIRIWEDSRQVRVWQKIETPGE